MMGMEIHSGHHGPGSEMADHPKSPTGLGASAKARFFAWASTYTLLVALQASAGTAAQAAEGSGGAARAAGEGASPAEVGTGQSFFEPFDRLSQTRWFVSDGWSNGGHQSCTWRRRNIRIDDGVLSFKLDLEPDAKRAKLEEAENSANAPAGNERRIGGEDQPAPPNDGKDGAITGTDKKEPAEKPPLRYACAEIQTKQVFGYGTYEVRMRPAIGAGTVSAFFTYIGPPIAKGKPHDEIDIEFLGKDTREVQFNFFQDGKDAGGRLHAFGYNAASRMTDLAFVWKPGSIRWYVNGKFVHERLDEPGKPLPSEPSKIYLSLWSGQGRDMVAWLGAFTEDVLPIAASFDHVAFTRLGEPCQFPESVACASNETPPQR